MSGLSGHVGTGRARKYSGVATTAMRKSGPIHTATMSFPT
jgi:hypothetical protein